MRKLTERKIETIILRKRNGAGAVGIRFFAAEIPLPALRCSAASEAAARKKSGAPFIYIAALRMAVWGFLVKTDKRIVKVE